MYEQGQGQGMARPHRRHPCQAPLQKGKEQPRHVFARKIPTEVLVLRTLHWDLRAWLQTIVPMLWNELVRCSLRGVLVMTGHRPELFTPGDFHAWLCSLLACLKAPPYTVKKSLFFFWHDLFLLFATKHTVWFDLHRLFLSKPVQERIENLFPLRHRNAFSPSYKTLLLTTFFHYALSHLIC